MIKNRMPFSRDTVRRLKEQGFFDVGATYRLIGGFSKYPQHKRWDRDTQDD